MPDIAPLSEEQTQQLLETLRAKLAASGLGVTLQQDANGAWGEMGSMYLTLRYSQRNRNGNLIEVTAKILSVSSLDANAEQARLDREDK
jgi:hypothetical protein